MGGVLGPILVVSHSAAACRLLHLLLERAGYPSVETGDGDAALSALAARAPPLVVIDLREPDEELLFLAALVQKRHPSVPRLLLHVGSARLVSGGQERSVESEALEHFPTVDALRRAVVLATSEHALAVLRPAVAKA